jgi:hypothetical protein
MLTVLLPHQPASFKPIEIYEYHGHQNGLQIQFHVYVCAGRSFNQITTILMLKN